MTKIGEIYFIRERDRVDGGKSSYVKIGMVGDTERGSSERLNEHQTGNPRDLELHHVTQTPAPFRVEKFLHQHFGAKRVRSEWFALTDKELQEAVRISERIAKEAFTFLPILEKAAELKRSPSSGEKLSPTPLSTDWHMKLMTAKLSLSVCKEMKSSYQRVASQLSPSDRHKAELEEMIVVEEYVDKRFDEDGFRVKYPKLHQQFTQSVATIGGRFTPSKLKTTEIDPELAQFETEFTKACVKVENGSLAFEALFDLKRDLEMHEGAFQWEAEIADAQLRALCGTAPGIEGQCTWNRAAKLETKFDLLALEKKHPKKAEEFLTRTIRTRTKTSKRGRRQRVE